MNPFHFQERKNIPTDIRIAQEYCLYNPAAVLQLHDLDFLEDSADHRFKTCWRNQLRGPMLLHIQLHDILEEETNQKTV
jgi:hypothetical protein